MIHKLVEDIVEAKKKAIDEGWEELPGRIQQRTVELDPVGEGDCKAYIAVEIEPKCPAVFGPCPHVWKHDEERRYVEVFAKGLTDGAVVGAAIDAAKDFMPDIYRVVGFHYVN